MGVIVLDDGNARIEVVAYSELFESARNWVKEDQLLLVEAKVSNRIGDDENGGELRISAERLYDLDSARSRYAKNIKLYCNGSSSGAKLKEILAPYLRSSNIRSAVHGGLRNSVEQYCPVWVVYRNYRALCELELGEAWRVSLEESLIQSLEAHFKAGNVEITY
jgi:DNA polymerase-3 subunit alpha